MTHRKSIFFSIFSFQGTNLEPRQKFFEQLAHEWDFQQPDDREAHLRFLLSKIDSYLQRDKRVLVIGSGTGVLSPLLLDYCASSQTISLDIAFAMLAIHRKQDADAGIIHGDAHHLPLAAETFDCVICHDSFPHFQNQSAVLNEVSRVLTNNGHLVIMHDINREQVNHTHRMASSTAIQNDLLPDSAHMSNLLNTAGLREVKFEEGDNFYLAVGEK